MINFFTDPVLRAPTLGCMLMCLTCALVGVIVFIRKESLLGETLSHATYPGIMLGAIWTATTTFKSFLTWGLLGAAIACTASLYLLNKIQAKFKLKSDSALCLILTLFFGIGITFSSYLQNTYSSTYKQARVFLFGQAATITDSYLFVYAILAAIVVLTVLLFYKQIQIVNLDPTFARTVGIPSGLILVLCYFLLIVSIVIGLRSIGLFLLSGMLIGPAIAARQWTDRLSRMFVLAGFIGLLSGFLGMYISVKVAAMSDLSLSLPTGPTIILVSALISILSLLFAPKRGWITRYLRSLKFRKRCNEENILKSLWYFEQKNKKGILDREVLSYQGISKLHFNCLLIYLHFKGDILRIDSLLQLTEQGKRRAQNIVRMHRLWELYLVHIGVGKDHVHHNAEEMEHIITPQIENQLLKVMKNPVFDPHDQPIPVRSV